MNLGTEEYDWFSVMLDAMGQEKGLAYMRALAKQDLQLPGPSSRMRVQLMLAGESAIALAARGRRVIDFKEQGAPIDFRIFEPYAGEPNSLAIMARAPHPHATILFTDYLLSQEGQVMLANIPGSASVKGSNRRAGCKTCSRRNLASLIRLPTAPIPNNSSINSIRFSVFGLERESTFGRSGK